MYKRLIERENNRDYRSGYIDGRLDHTVENLLGLCDEMKRAAKELRDAYRERAAKAARMYAENLEERRKERLEERAEMLGDVSSADKQED